MLSFASTFAVVCLAAVLGTPLAYALSRYKFRGKRFVSLFIELPIVMPPAVAGLALLLTFGRNGVIGSLLADSGVIIPFSILAVIIAQFFISAPFYIRSAQVGFSSIADEIEDAARVDGAYGWLMFWYITLPIAWRALISGMILELGARAGRIWRDHSLRRQLAGQNSDDAVAGLQYLRTRHRRRHLDWLGLDRAGHDRAVLIAVVRSRPRSAKLTAAVRRVRLKRSVSGLGRLVGRRVI